MSAGYQVGLGDINQAAGNIAQSVRDSFTRMVTFKAWLDGITDATLLLTPYLMAQSDINDLRSAMSDLNQLNNIRIGSVNLAVAKDFTAFTKRLTGVV